MLNLGLLNVDGAKPEPKHWDDTMYQEGDDPVEDWVITNNVFDGCGTSQVISYDILCDNDNYFILQCLVLATWSHVDWRLQEYNSCS